MKEITWRRVNKELRCGPCGHSDWCTVSEIGWCCMRITSNRQLANGGYLHPLDDKQERKPLPRPEPARPSIDAKAIIQDWEANTKTEWVEKLGAELGVSYQSLKDMGVAWSRNHKAWGWPMCNGAGDIVGIRLRSVDGSKWSVTGGREGVFMPRIPAHKTLWLPEGPTDTAALLTLGLFAIGRPNNRGGAAHLDAIIGRHNITRAVILADTDSDKMRPNGTTFNPGADGALALSENLSIPTCILLLPCKDSREFVKCGGTKELLETLASQLVWRNP